MRQELKRKRLRAHVVTAKFHHQEKAERVEEKMRTIGLKRMKKSFSWIEDLETDSEGKHLSERSREYGMRDAKCGQDG